MKLKLIIATQTKFALQTQPLLAHSGHQHGTEHVQEEKKALPEEPTSSEITQPSQLSEPAIISHSSTNFIPQPGELILLLLLTFPWILFLIKQKINNQ